MAKQKLIPLGRCKTCTHWNNKQAELSYDTFNGICTAPHLKYHLNSYGTVTVLDRANLHPKAWNNVHRFENQSGVVPIGATERSQYCLVTEETYGCIHHKK